MAVITLYLAAQKQITTYPLTNRTRRQLNFFSTSAPTGFITEEMMLPNTTQTYSTVPDTSSKRLRLPLYRSDIFTVGGIAWAATYSVSSLYDKLFLGTHQSVSLDLPPAGGALAYSSNSYKSLSFTAFVSVKSLTIPSGTQTISYSPAHSKVDLIWPTHLATGIGPVASAFTLDYTGSVKPNLVFSGDSISISDTLEIPSTSFVLNYGGDNTFYSLNGFFNYFRYRHQDLMASNYHILIGAKLINMYNSNMVCIESHRAGYKSVTVTASFLKDDNGNWLSKHSLKHLFYEDRFVFYDNKNGLLYTYDFDNIALSSMSYYNIDSTLKPQAVSLFLDPTYKMPYIMPVSTEGAQVLTQEGEFWNFIQINNIKNITACLDVDAAKTAYVHDVFSPTSLYLDNILFRYKNGFILEGYRGQTERSLYYLDLDSPSDISTIFSYTGSKVIYAEYPVAYFSTHKSEFRDDSSYGRLVKLNLETMDLDVTKIDHYNYQVIKDVYVWHLYKQASNDAYYLFREDDPDKRHNLTVCLNLGSAEILEFMVFNSYEIYVLTSDRKIYTFNTQTMQVVLISTFGTPLLFIKFNSSIGCVLTRSGTKMYFEELQPILWSSNPDDWITPYDMKKGERLLPYTLLTRPVHKRTAPIKTVANTLIVERMSDKQVALERGVVGEIRRVYSESLISTVKVGRCNQQIYANGQYTAISPVITEAAAVDYAKDITVDVVMNEDDTFTLSIEDIGIPEQLTRGFKIYEK